MANSSGAIILGVAESKVGPGSALVDGLCSPSDGDWHSFRICFHAGVGTAAAPGIGHGAPREQRVVADAIQQ